MDRGADPGTGKRDLPEDMVEKAARMLIEAAERVPGARVPIIAAEELAREAINAVSQAGCLRMPYIPERA